MMAMSITALGVVTVLWFTFVFGMCFGPKIEGDPTNFIGNPLSYVFFQNMGSPSSPLMMPPKSDGTPNGTYGPATLPGWLFALYQNKFAVITPALASGAVADRLNLTGWLLFMTLWLILVYAPWCHMIWGGGYFAEKGVVDFAGGIVIHTSSGWASLSCAKFLGPRDDQGERPHSVPLVVIGTALLWFGWFGFNGGSAFAADSVAITAMVNSQVAASAGMVGWGILHWANTGKLGLVPLCVGCIAGLATITPAAGFVQPWAAFIYGSAASVWCYYFIKICKEVLKVDDALDVWAVHGMGGGLGSILIGVFADDTSCMGDSPPDYCVNPGSVAASKEQFGVQIECVVLCAMYSFVVSYVIMLFLWGVMDIYPDNESKMDEECLGEATYDLFDAPPEKLLAEPILKKAKSVAAKVATKERSIPAAAPAKKASWNPFCCRQRIEVPEVLGPNKNPAFH